MQQSMRLEQNTPTTNDESKNSPPTTTTTTTMTEEEALLSEIATLESRLATARSKLKTQPTPTPTLSTYAHALSLPQTHTYSQTPAHMHTLLLLSDSALPLGSFAFSSGLESYLAHHKPSPTPLSPSSKTTPHPNPNSNPVPKPNIQTFLSLSLFSVASALFPYLLAAYRHPADLCQLDNDLDASTPCTVARRASVAQGRALLSVWERAFRPSASTASSTASSPSSQPSPPKTSTTPTTPTPPSASAQASEAQASAQALATTTLTTFSLSLRHPPSPSPSPCPPSGHLPPLFSVISLSLQIPLPQTAYTFLLLHCKAVLSAGVRAGVLGPYQAQAVLASGWLRAKIEEALERNWNVQVQEAGQGVPVLDLWVGRHEVLYSRIFNS